MESNNTLNIQIPLVTSYTSFPDDRILLNGYISLAEQAGHISSRDYTHVLEVVQSGALHQWLSDPENDEYCDNSITRQILLYAYDYEVRSKFLLEDVKNNEKTNEILMGLFNQYYGFDYQSTINAYCKKYENPSLIERSQYEHSFQYNKQDEAVVAYFRFIDWLLESSGHGSYASPMHTFMSRYLQIYYEEGISGTTYIDQDHIIIKVGNHTRVTLFHELTHAVLLFFKSLEEIKPLAVNLARHNEGVCNLIAYHLHDQIMQGQYDIVGMDLEARYFSYYIDVYAHMYEHGFADREKNYRLMHDELIRFEGNLMSDVKARYYFNRFYRYFHFDQHKYMFPKELMYALGYDGTLAKMRKADDKQQCLVDLLMYQDLVL